MPAGAVPTATRSFVFLLLLGGLVHALLAGPVSAQEIRKSVPKDTATDRPAVRYGTTGLPLPVIDMRDAILAAVRSGRIEEIKGAMELNELKPSFGDSPPADPVAWLKAASADGQGRDILAALANILEAGFVSLPLGRDAENTAVFVWPYFAEIDVAALTPAQEVELLRLVPPAEAARMRAAGRYDFWRIGIGADGVWHFLRK